MTRDSRLTTQDPRLPTADSRLPTHVAVDALRAVPSLVEGSVEQLCERLEEVQQVDGAMVVSEQQD